MRAVDRVSHYEFPVQLDDANRALLCRHVQDLRRGEQGAAMTAIVADPSNATALAVLDQNMNWHAMLRTTCVATMLSAGHATNALPQRATANINCRIFPGVTREEVLAQLIKVADDPAVTVRVAEIRGPAANPAPLTRRILKPVETVANELAWSPGDSGARAGCLGRNSPSIPQAYRPMGSRGMSLTPTAAISTA